MINSDEEVNYFNHTYFQVNFIRLLPSITYYAKMKVKTKVTKIDNFITYFISASTYNLNINQDHSIDFIYIYTARLKLVIFKRIFLKTSTILFLLYSIYLL